MTIKSTAQNRRIDKLGRFVIPSHMRDTLSISEHDLLEVTLEGDHIAIRPSSLEKKCSECHEEKDILLGASKICPECVASLSRGDYS